MKYRGVAYYPEYWPEERWDEDIRLMTEARINTVRVGEFAWIAMEPAEGRYALDWLHRLFEKTGEAGIGVLLCTPTAAPPAWLTSNYPETLMVQEDGTRHTHGIRRHYCPTNRTYRNFCRAITAKLCEEFGAYENLVGWHLDNELGPERGRCYCEHCQAQYRAWLQGRYGSLEELNRRWQTRFWSVEFTDWAQVRMATGDRYPSIKLDTRRFQSDAYVDFAAEQTAVIREQCQGALITTNGMGPLFEPINYYDLYAMLDRASADQYFDIADMSADALACDAFRGYIPSAPWWMTETGSGALSNDKVPEAGQLRAWAYSALARGCEMWCFFRWRTALSGQEQELQGVLEYSGLPKRRYAAVKALFSELETVWPRFADLPPVRPKVGLVFDYTNDWAYRAARVGEKVQYKQHIEEIYRAFYDRNIPVEIAIPARELDNYSLVVIPSLPIVDPAFAGKLFEFVAKGGTVLSFPQLACRDPYNNYLPDEPPVGLRGLFGLRVAGGMYLRSYVGPDEALWHPKDKYTDQTPGVKLTLAGGETHATMRTWMEDIELDGGRALGVYTDNSFTGCPAVVEHHYGAGRTLYLGAYPNPDLLGWMVEEALLNTGITSLPTPQWVEVVPRGEYTFIMNHTPNPVRVPIQATEAVVGVYADGEASLAGYDVCVVR
ncbi:MAG: Beta-galactosidase bgaB [bacterium ADurb.Bin429]|nr:MAG: Beta-galactosidase bgaB [bacterium ADurb.Bin429]